MSVAAGIEIVTSGRPEPGQSQVPTKAPGKAQGTGWAGAPGASPSSSSEPGAESFRTSWKSVLASLGAGLDGLSEEEAGAGGVSASAEPDLAQAAQTGSPATLTLLSGAALSLRQGRAPQGGSAASATMLSLAVSRAGIPAWRTASGAALQTAANPTAKGLESAHPAESAPGTHPANSGKSEKLKAASSPTATSLVSATVGSVPLSMAVPDAGSPVANAIEATPRSLPTNRSIDLPTGFAGDSVNLQPSHADVPGAATGRTSTAGNRAVDAAGTASLPGKASSAPATAPMAAGRSASADEDLDGTEASLSGRTEAWTAGEEALSPGQIRLQVEQPIQTLTQSQRLIQAQPGNQGLEAVAAPIASDGGDRESPFANIAASQAGQSPAALPVAGKPVLASGGRTSGQAALRLAHAPGMGESAGNGNRPLDGHAAGAATDASVEASTLARDQADTHGALSAANDMAGSSTGAAAGPSARETFAALDSESAPRTPAWIHAGAQRAEAGFQDPALGWVGVRADMGTGGIHAALVPDSADAAQALGGHLAGLNSYLAEQHTPVETLTLASPEGRWSEPGTNQGMDQGEGRNTGQGTSSDSQLSPQPGSPAPAVAASSEVSALSGRMDAGALPRAPGGVHISVMA